MNSKEEKNTMFVRQERDIARPKPTKSPRISHQCLDANRVRRLASIGFPIEPLYLRVFHNSVSLEALALVFGFDGIKGISLAKGQPFLIFLYHLYRLTQVTEAIPQTPPAIATDKGEVGELLPCSLTSICLVLSYVEK